MGEDEWAKKIAEELEISEREKEIEEEISKVWEEVIKETIKHEEISEEIKLPEIPKREEIEFYAVNPPHAYVRISYDQETHERIYEVLEPELTEGESMLVSELKEFLVESIDVDLRELKKGGAKNYLLEKMEEMFKKYGIKVSERSKSKVEYYILRDFLGFGKIDPIMRDVYIEDVSCDGPEIPVFVYHRKHESLKTNVIFKSEEELDYFVIRLAQISGKHISISNPLIDATLPDGSRVQLTFGREVTTRGSTFTIRKFRIEPITPPELIELGTFSGEMMAYFWLAVDAGRNIMFAGGTASGKTTSLNATALFIRPEMKIVSIEDTREINLPHPNWIPSVTRETFIEGATGEIDMYDLLRAALRQRPEYIILGEVRGEEAYVLFQAMATGHSTFSTIHGDSVESVVHRLENPPINIPRIMIQHLDIVSVQVQVRENDKRVRRCKTITEVVGLDARTGELITNDVFLWDAVKKEFRYTGRSFVLEEIKAQRGWSDEELKEELKRRYEILEWMRRKGIKNYRDVTKVIVTYYRAPEKILRRVKEEK
jgi:flagellar protein FlaI